jgi:nitrous oxidase accessory protein
MQKQAAWLLQLFLLTASLATLPLPVKAQPKTITVPDDYPSIQQAVDQANNGDTVFVRAGYYDGAVDITKPISLIGEDNKAIINNWLDKIRAAILITSHNVTVSGFTIDNNSNDTIWSQKRGIHLLGANDCTIQDNIVKKCDSEGIWLYQSSNNHVINNTVENGSTCISIGASSNNQVTNNKVRRICQQQR